MTTPCYFCPDTAPVTKYDRPKFAKHIVEQHGFTTGSFLISDIEVSRAKYRIIFPESPVCPIPGCKAGKLLFNNDSLGAHLRKKGNVTEPTFLARIAEGYYFSWRINIKNNDPLEKVKSPSFNDTGLFNEAMQRFSQPPEANLDPADDAGHDSNNIDDLDDEFDLEGMNDAMHREGMYVNVDVGINPASTTSAPDNSISPTTPQHRTLQNIPGLICPPALLTQGLALLALPQFHPAAILPVCIKCRTAINSTAFRKAQEHICHAPITAELGPYEEIEDITREEETREDDAAMELDDSDPNQVDGEDAADITSGIISHDAARTTWKAAREFYAQPTHGISPLKSPYPSSIISPLPFFNTEQGYACPVEGCVRAFQVEAKAKQHARTHDISMDSPDAPFAPLPCSMQTIIRGTYFRVQEDVAPPTEPTHPTSISDFMESTLTIHHSASSAHPQGDTPLTGLSHRNPFMKRFDYQSIYPPSLKDYKAFITSKVPQISPVYKRSMKPRHHLLAIVSLVYHMHGCHRLGQGDDLTRRQLGNKLKSSQLGSQPRLNSFKPLQKFSSTITYSAFFAAFVAYALDVHDDPSVDPDLQLSPEHQDPGNALSRALESELKSEILLEALTKVKNMSNEAIFACPPHYFNHPALQGLVLDVCLRLQDVFHAFAFALIKFPRHLRPTQSIFATPTNRFLALRAWNIDINVFRDVVPLHNQMAHLQWSLRLVVYEEYLRSCPLLATSDPYDILCSLKDDCASQDATTAFGMLQDQLRYASALTASVTVAPDATWNEITQTAHLNEISVSRHKLQEMLHTLVEKAYGIMDHDILFDRREDVFVGRKDGIATFDRPNSIQDLPNAANEGYSYLRANSCFTKERDGLANFIKRDATMQDRFTLPYLVDNKPVWNLPEIHRYVSVIDDFKSILACLVYWLSGMPPRGTEFTGTLICNTSQRRRNLLCAQGDLVMEHTYTKSESSTGFGRPVMRLPAHPLQRLLEEYIVVVKPVYDAFILLLRGETADTTTEYHSLLWTLDGHEMTPAELSKSLRRLSMQYLGFPIGLRPWRQLMIQFATYILPLEIRNLPLTTYVITAQASHGQGAEDKNYNRQAGLTFEQVCSSQFGEYRRASLAWVEAFGFPHPTLRSCVTVHGAQPTFDPDHMITEISARVIAGMKAVRQEEQKDQLARHVASQVQSSPFPCRFQSLNVAVTPKALTLLQSLYPNVKSFRSPEQGMCIEYAMQGGANPLFVIHPMGHGKSSIYLAPMVSEKGLKTTVLVVPLLSLAQSAAANAQALGFNAKFFNPTTSNPQAVEQFLSLDLVVMTYDLISANAQIWAWLSQMAQGERLTRVVIDEAHTIVTESHYRPRFTTLYGRAVLLKVPIIFLSGTMPEKVCHQLLDTFQDHRMVYLSRLPGDRPQLAYSVESQISASPESISSFCLRVQAEFFPQMAQDTQARLIIFARKVEWANSIAATLGTRLYTGPRPLHDKQQDLAEWMSNDEQTIGQRVLSATSATALGLDRDNVNYVLLFGDPHDAITMVQMAARAGRNGQHAPVRLFPLLKTEMNPDETIEAFKATVGCRRVPLSQLLDDRSITCSSLPLAARCDNCSQEVPYQMPVDTVMQGAILMAPSLSIQERDLQMTTLVAALYEALDTLQVGCCLCMLSNLPSVHKIEACPCEHQAKIVPLEFAVKSHYTRTSIPGLSICIHCNMPQKAGYGRGMDEHAKYCDMKTTECKLKNHSNTVILALLASSLHRDLILNNTPGKRPTLALAALLTPVTESPCSPRDTGRQLLVLHFLIVAAVAKSLSPGPLVKEVASQAWFQPWMTAYEPTGTVSLLHEVDVGKFVVDPVSAVPTKRPQYFEHLDAPPTKKMALETKAKASMNHE